MSAVVSHSQRSVALPINVSLVDGPIGTAATPEKGDVQKQEDSVEVSAVAGTGEKLVGDLEKRLLGLSRGSAVRGRVRQARGITGATFSSKMEVQFAMSDVINSNEDTPAQSILVQGGNTQVEMEHEEQTYSISDKSPIGNGETINLSETEYEGEMKEDIMNMTAPGNGIVSISGQLGSASSPGTTQDHDSEMQVDQVPDRTDQVSISLTLSNGNAITPSDERHRPTAVEMETSHPAAVASPNRGPIAVCSEQHCWALRDHTLYCWPGTWEEEEVSCKDQPEESGIEEMQSKQSLEELIDMVHEFLENFYMKYGSFIPLSETDVLEHLKKKGICEDLSNKGLNIQEEVTRYRTGLASVPVAGFMVMYNKHNLSLEDLGTLEEQNWLNDQIINMYGELMMEATQHKVHFFNSFFHKQLVAKGYDGVKRWTKKVDLFSKWLLLIPIHLEIHWSLVTVAMATKTINYYDSQGIVFRHTTDNIMKYLQSEAREKKQTAFQKGWKITIIKGIPQQKNDSDCGVFVLEYCRCLSVKQPLLFSQEDMPRIRKRIYKELCDCRLND
ncbi:uncharacterized protein ACBR49_007857 [Aulostomus maculatus]